VRFPAISNFIIQAENKHSTQTNVLKYQSFIEFQEYIQTSHLIKKGEPGWWRGRKELNRQTDNNLKPILCMKMHKEYIEIK